MMTKLINDNFPEEYLHVVEGGVPITTELLSHRFDKIFFTGSIPVGRIIYQAAAKHLTPVTLELGGKSPTFVMKDCNLKITAKRIAWGKFLNSGQTCVAPDYILVEESIKKEFLNHLIKELEVYPQKSGTKHENYLRIINEKNFDRLVTLIDEKKCIYGGNTDRENLFISPTILNDCNFEDPIMQDEIFGPILPILSFTNLEEVIHQVKSRPKPLSCYIYSKNTITINKILSELSFGGGGVNENVMHLTNSNLPFGGVGFSGFGSYHGKAGFDNATHYKSILHKPFWIEPPFKYAPYTSFNLNIIKKLIE